MSEKIAQLWPEITLAITATLIMILGLSPKEHLRKATPWLAAIALLFAILIASISMAQDGSEAFPQYIKITIAAIGILLLGVIQGTPESLKIAKQTDSHKIKFDPANVVAGEFYAFFLMSIVGAMLCASATDLPWLFLALELTSLPTYVMIAISKDNANAQEASVKYFFLGALSAACFLYGFTLIYGATGHTQFTQIQIETQIQLTSGRLSPLFIAGMLLSVLGIAFKIAAAPMHFYTADVYQGAATGLAAFLAFIPKTAGFVSLILVLNLLGTDPSSSIWNPQSPAHVIITLIAILAAITMTLGNVMGIIQKTNVKRVLAYSSIAHSGYLMLGLVAGPYATSENQAMGNGLAGILYYLIAYALANLAAFAVLASITHNNREAQTYQDLAGLRTKSKPLFIVMVLAMLSLMGLPPLMGFNGKAFLFGSASAQGYHWLVILGVVNSAISAVYYLRIISTCYFEPTLATTQVDTHKVRHYAAYLASACSVLFFLNSSGLIDQASKATLSIDHSSKKQPLQTTEKQLIKEKITQK